MIGDERKLSACPAPFVKRLSELYDQPQNLLEVHITEPRINGVGKDRYCDYKVMFRTSVGHFKTKSSVIRRRYRQFEMLRDYIFVNHASVIIAELPPKSVFHDRYSDAFLEERRVGLEKFLHRYVARARCGASVVSHPLLQSGDGLDVVRSFLNDELFQP